MGRFQPGVSGNPNGRPVGSKQRLPDKDLLCDLLDRICDDLTANYERLTTAQKIRIMTSFTNLYQDSALRELQDAIVNATSGVITFDFMTSENERD